MAYLDNPQNQRRFLDNIKSVRLVANAAKKKNTEDEKGRNKIHNREHNKMLAYADQFENLVKFDRPRRP